MLKEARGKLWHHPINIAKGGERRIYWPKKSAVFRLLLALIVGQYIFFQPAQSVLHESSLFSQWAKSPKKQSVGVHF